MCSLTIECVLLLALVAVDPCQVALVALVAVQGVAGNPFYPFS